MSGEVTPKTVTQKIVLLLVLGATLGSGCIMPRVPHALARASSPLETTYLMPARLIHYGRPVDTNAVLRDVNVVLDGMVQPSNHLLGPTTTMRLQKESWPALDIDLGSSAVLESMTADEKERLTRWAQASTCRRVVLTRVSITVDWRDRWRKCLMVESWLWGLDPPRQLAHCYRQNESSIAMEGVGTFMGPGLIVFGTTFAHALDEAMRSALIDLFKQERQSTNDTPKQ
jgi:hypothetical protein